MCIRDSVTVGDHSRVKCWTGVVGHHPRHPQAAGREFIGPTENIQDVVEAFGPEHLDRVAEVEPSPSPAKRKLANDTTKFGAQAQRSFKSRRNTPDRGFGSK